MKISIKRVVINYAQPIKLLYQALPHHRSIHPVRFFHLINFIEMILLSKFLSAMPGGKILLRNLRYQGNKRPNIHVISRSLFASLGSYISMLNHLNHTKERKTRWKLDSLVDWIHAFGFFAAIKPDGLRHLNLVVVLKFFSLVREKMLCKKFIHLLMILLICVVLKRASHRRHKKPRAHRQAQQNFHEVDAFGDDFIDFGAQTGPHGQFSWHADFPLER